MTGAAGPHPRVVMSFPADAASVRLAREFCASTLAAWSLHQVIDDAVLLVSELVTIALAAPLPEVGLVLAHVGDHVDITVRGCDAGRLDLSGGQADPGLLLVSAISSARGAHCDGEAVWRIRLPEETGAEPQPQGRARADTGTDPRGSDRRGLGPVVDQGHEAPLTSRRVLLLRLERSLARTTATGPASVAAVVIDLDAHQIEAIAGSYGYETAENLMSQALRRLDEISPHGVARTSGNQFLVIVEGHEDKALEVAERMLARLSECFVVAARRLYVHGRAGIAAGSCRTAEELLRHAYAATHQARQSGSGRMVVFDQGIATESEERLSLLADFREALAEDQLQLHYQPVIDLHSGRIIGVEALLRWSHPSRGSVPPELFVRAAEGAGLCDQLDRWVLHRAADQYRTITAALGPDATVSVNISASDLSTGDVEQAVRHALLTHGMPGCALVLEITEGAVMTDPDRARSVLDRLRSLGVRVALDDFGTGYSSLGQLTRLPVQHLKIDRCFVRDIVDDQDARRLATSIVDMAHSLRMIAIAEGVETQQQMQLLRSFGCHAAQGFLWSPAVPAHELEQLARAQPLHRPGPRGDDVGRPDPRRDRVHLVTEGARDLMMRMAERGASPATIAAALNAAGHRTLLGRRWHHATVSAVLHTSVSADQPTIPAPPGDPATPPLPDRGGTHRRSAGHPPAAAPLSGGAQGALSRRADPRLVADLPTSGP